MADPSARQSVPQPVERPGDMLAELARHRMLSDLPASELEWLVARGELYHVEPGELAAMQPMLDTLVILIAGHLAIYVDHGAGPHKVMEWRGGDISGLLPYSRMTKSLGDVVVLEPTEVFLIHVHHFPDMIHDCPVLTTTLVHHMVDRARHFRSSELQDEKMLSLGRISAGLAHELNNPASAAARSAGLLANALDESEAAAQALGAARLNEAQLAAVSRTRTVCATTPPSALGPLARADREDSIADWLAAHGADRGAAQSLAETAVSIEALDSLASSLDAETLNVALRWVAAGCTTRALAGDIQRAATRIHNLVGAIKRFTYMDRAQVPEAVDVVESLHDSLALLMHKARKKSVAIDVRAEPDLPSVCAIGGDLNQVWTNLIDNALDAVAEAGRITVSAARQLNRVVVRIVDDGGGIPAEIKDRIFDPFVTTKPVGQGTGLGLDIARQLIRRNNGDIEVESRPGHTEFRVTLPTASDMAPAPPR